MPKSKEVANKELNENNETRLCDSHLEIIDADNEIATQALETAFLKSTSVLLIIGAVCSAISKMNNVYVFFDSHSHGETGFSSSDGTSILMLFSCLEDLVTYLYGFYESMCIDLTM